MSLQPAYPSSLHVPTPEPVPPGVPPMPGMPDPTHPEPVNPEPAPPVQEPPGEGEVPTRLPGHPGQPVHVLERAAPSHAHAVR